MSAMSPVREIRRLFGIHARMRFGLSSLRVKNTGKDRFKQIGMAVLILYAVAAVLFTYAMVLYPMMRGAVEAGIGIVLLGAVILLCMIIVLLFGTMNLIGVVFMAKDAEFYSALPLRPQSVFMAKFFMVYLTELCVSAALWLPACAMYMWFAGFSAAFLARILAVWLLLPAIPLALAAALAMPLVRLTALSRHRDALMLALSVLLLVGAMIGQVALSSGMSGLMTDPSMASELLSSAEKMMSAVTSVFPPANWAAQTAAGSGADAAVGAACYVLVVAAGLGLCLLLSRSLYARGVLAQLEAPKGKTRGYSSAGIKAGSAMGAFFSKEWKLLVRTPIYAMNSFTGVVMIPLMLIIFKFTGNAGSGGVSLTQLLSSALAPGDAAFVTAAFVAFVAMTEVGLSTTFSREGNMLWLSQTAPVTARTQTAARLLCGMAIVALSLVPISASAVFLIGLPAAEVIPGALMGLCAAFPMAAAAMIPDCLRPKRKWNTEAEAMKQNMNSLIGMLLTLGVAAPIVVLILWLRSADISPFITGGVVAVVSAVAGWLLFGAAAKLAGRMMETVDG